MTSPRLRRLQLDEERLKSRFRGHQHIQVKSVSGFPPEKYYVTYFLNGLYTASSGQILERSEHLMEINLSLNYPRRAPQCKMLTPIFHPNFDESSVCIGDFWAASEGLDDLVVRIGRMIAFQEYNTKSPLNGIAAKWTEEHIHLLPVDNRNVSPSDHIESFDLMETVIIRMPAPARLEFAETTYLLDEENMIIGRGEASNIQIINPTLSVVHAEIYSKDGDYYVRDLNSTNGTFVNNVKISSSPIMLADRDVIFFGEINCSFCRE